MRRALIREHPAMAASFIVDVDERSPCDTEWRPVASKEFKLSPTRNENLDRALAYAKENMLPND